MSYIGNIIGESIIRALGDKTLSFQDENNITWKVINDEWIGKRSVWTKDNRGCWLEDTTIDNVKTWWCGKDADYNEIFKENK